MPRRGVWHAELSLDASSDAGLLGAGELVWRGGGRWGATVQRGGVAYGDVFVRLVGGAGGLATELPGQTYRETTVRVVVDAIARGTGERLSGLVETSTLSLRLGHWARLAGPASTQLLELTRALGLSWRVLLDGSLWIGDAKPTPAPSIDATVLSREPARGRVTLGSVEGWRLDAGQLLEGVRIEQLEHRLEAGDVRTVVLL